MTDDTTESEKGTPYHPYPSGLNIAVGLVMTVGGSFMLAAEPEPPPQIAEAERNVVKERTASLALEQYADGNRSISPVFSLDSDEEQKAVNKELWKLRARHADSEKSNKKIGWVMTGGGALLLAFVVASAASARRRKQKHPTPGNDTSLNIGSYP